MCSPTFAQIDLDRIVSPSLFSLYRYKIYSKPSQHTFLTQYLSNLFSEVEGTTIEQFFILQKIEKAKELLVYGELTLSQIASDLGYSSVAHLSNQFKKVTGLTPSHFKKVRDNKRKPIDKL